ncbi:hypothetical protein PCE1_003827 [Barthelona sp. PCE]
MPAKKAKQQTRSTKQHFKRAARRSRYTNGPRPIVRDTQVILFAIAQLLKQGKRKFTAREVKIVATETKGWKPKKLIEHNLIKKVNSSTYELTDWGMNQLHDLGYLTSVPLTPTKTNKHMISITSCFREQEIFERLVNSGAKCQTSHLIIADFLFQLSPSKVYDFAIERKTVSDAISSFGNGKGRLLEQIHRMEQIFTNILIILEGLPNDDEQQKFYEVYSYLVNHKINVILTTTPQNTVDFLCGIRQVLLSQRIRQFDFAELENCSKERALSHVTITDMLMRILCVCPGVSARTAKIIAYEYGTLANLLSALDDDPNILKETYKTTISRKISTFFGFRKTKRRLLPGERSDLRNSATLSQEYDSQSQTFGTRSQQFDTDVSKKLIYVE